MCNHKSPRCWLEQGGGTFGCSQASSLHCGVSRAGKFTSLSLSLSVQLALTILSCLQQQSNLCGPWFLGHLPTQDLSLLLSHSAGSRDKACGHDKDVSACSLPAGALLQLDLHLSAALGLHNEHPPNLCGVPTLPWDQECTVQGARHSVPSSYPHCKPGE